MVTRQTVEEKVLSEIQSSISTNSNISSEDVYLRGADVDIDRPRIIYHTVATDQNYNNASNAYYGKVLDSNDDVVAHVYREYIELTFNIEVLSESQTVANGIYEDIRKHFLRYHERIDDYRNIDSEINNVSVETDNRESEYAVNPTQRFTYLPVNVEFYRKITEDGVPIQQVTQDVEGKTFVTDTKS
jgi:hypothetical protein